MTDYNDGNWWGWNGGKCPVSADDEVDAVFLSGSKVVGMKANVLEWDHSDLIPDPIIAFRVTSRAPRELWLVLEADGRVIWGRDNMDDAVKSANPWPGRTVMHVREVRE